MVDVCNDLQMRKKNTLKRKKKKKKYDGSVIFSVSCTVHSSKTSSSLEDRTLRSESKERLT